MAYSCVVYLKLSVPAPQHNSSAKFICFRVCFLFGMWKWRRLFCEQFVCVKDGSPFDRPTADQVPDGWWLMVSDDVTRVGASPYVYKNVVKMDVNFGLTISARPYHRDSRIKIKRCAGLKRLTERNE